MVRVDFAKTFEERLETIQEFMLDQDMMTATARIEKLWSEILRFGDLVALHPKIGRPAGVLAAGSVEGQVQMARVFQLAGEAGLPELREYVLHPYLLLYAHSETHVLLLSIRHQRELGYTAG
jgi:hypothetical protein